MPKFIYKAKKGPDEAVEGVIEADSENVAVNKLIQSGCYPISVREESVSAEKFSIYKVRSKDITYFTRHLSELLGSGLTLYNALNVIESQSESNNLKMIIGNIKSRIKEGKKFSEALKNYPAIFSELYVNLVRSGEESGSLNEVLMNIADFLDKDEDTRSKVIAALAYPGLMALVGFATIFILVTFIVPRIVNMFIDMGQTLPLVTRILVGISDFIKTYWILLAVFIAGLVFVLKTAKSNPLAKNKMDRIKLKVPVFGKLVRDTELARFSRTFSMLLKNGVPMLDALQVTSGVITNSAVKDDIDAVYKDVKAGMAISGAIRKRECFPLFVSNMAAVGEEGGFLDKALLNIARNYEIEMDRAMKIITALLEPGFILIMGLVVGFIVVAMLLPVFEISLTAR
ncbi:MAG: type II secretion system F family protein [Candidatus Omnitrophota bacterium]|nr:type II secretion system F family protein [Candidatus Omnitrophota bacterium]